jgi:uncharacterized protein (TIGR02391 family)
MAIDKKVREEFKQALIRKGLDPKTATLYSKWLLDISVYYDIDDPKTLTFDEIKEYLEFIKKRRPANSVNTAFHAFNYYYNKIFKKGYPFDDLPRPVKERSKTIEIFSFEEIKKILDHADKLKSKVTLTLLYACGLDVSELARILRTDFDPERQILEIRNKNNKIYRESMLPRQVNDLLVAYLGKYKTEKYLFENRDKKKMGPRTFQSFFETAWRKSGLRKRGTLKTLKYCYIKHLESIGVPLILILEHLGLTSAESIRFYNSVGVDMTEKIKISPIELIFTTPKSDHSKLYTEFWRLINSKIVHVTRKKFESGFYSDAIESALKEINSTVKEITKQKTGDELDGSNLMQRAFSLTNPVIELDDLSTESGRNVQKGFLQIFAGAMTGIRNPKAHDNTDIEINEAVRLICFCGELMDKIEKGRK